MDTDLTMSMGAVGVRGVLLEPAQQGGFQLALRSDVLWMVMDSAAADNLAATEAEASRLRLVLEGSRPVALDGGGSFTPSLELGLRHDGGDAETGTGVEVGGRLSYASAWGLSIEASVRGLLAHEAEDYTEWGASGALRFDPGRQGRGLTASITPTWGHAMSGMSRLWGQQGDGRPGGGGRPGAHCGEPPRSATRLRPGDVSRARPLDALRPRRPHRRRRPSVAPRHPSRLGRVAELQPGSRPPGAGRRRGRPRTGPARQPGLLRGVRLSERGRVGNGARAWQRRGELIGLPWRPV